MQIRTVGLRAARGGVELATELVRWIRVDEVLSGPKSGRLSRWCRGDDRVRVISDAYAPLMAR